MYMEKGIHKLETLMSKLPAFEVEMSIEKLKINIPPDTDQIRAEIIKSDGRKFRSEIHKQFYSFWNRGELPEKWEE
jgi:hypothetical protein